MGTFIIGDVHASYATLLSLLKKINFNIDRDELIFLGDTIDRGPSAKKVLDFIHKYGYLCIMGNHEEKALRLAKGNKVQTSFALRDTRNQLGENWREYFLRFENYPYAIGLNDSQGKLYAFHGGWEANKTLEEQSENVLLRLRYFPHKKFNKNEDFDALSLPWQLQEGLKNIDFSLVHGHISVESVHAFCNPKIYSLDFGCPRPFSRLGGMWLDSREVVLVDVHDEDLAYYIDNAVKEK